MDEMYITVLCAPGTRVIGIIVAVPPDMAVFDPYDATGPGFRSIALHLTPQIIDGRHVFAAQYGDRWFIADE
jgi:hypothetical protein